MALSGAFLVLFVTFHALMNGVAIFWPTGYNMVCEFLGANWYALVGSLVLGAVVILHIVYAIWLTLQNRAARGHERYNVTSRPPQVEWASKNMLILGFVILAFLGLHLVNFWAKMQLAEICGTPAAEPMEINGQSVAVSPAAGTYFLQQTFSNGIFLACYIVAFIALWFHMTHGFWSMFQSAGWDNRTWLPRLKTIANWYTTIIIALFVAEAIVFAVQAKSDYYTTNDKLQEQYIEMAEGHSGAESTVAITDKATPCGMPECDNPACTPDCTSAVCGNPNCEKMKAAACPDKGKDCPNAAAGNCPNAGTGNCPNAGKCPNANDTIN